MSCTIGNQASTNKTRSIVGGGRLAATARRICRDDRILQMVLLALMFGLYGSILGAFHRITYFDPLDYTFNSMLEHLMHGQFDVDPQTVVFEGFSRNGQVFAYWGVWCALIRFPLWLFHRMDLDVTTWSCLVAVCLMGAAKIRTVLLLRRYSNPSPASQLALGLMLLYVLFGGSEISYLRRSIYQEVVFWAAAFGAVFVYLSVKGLLCRRFNAKILCSMALVSGLALLTRVSTGVGLCLAFTLLLVALFAGSVGSASDKNLPLTSRVFQALRDRRFFLSFGVLVIFVVATATVNYFRWGNPTTFADYHLYIGNKTSPDRLPRMKLYGLFNLNRIPFGLIYYFFPIWIVSGSRGGLLFAGTQIQMMDSVELPPSSFFLTDLLPICFIVLLGIALWKQSSRRLIPAQWLAIALGLAAPCLLMLTAVSMNFRYRMEFYPEIDLLAFLGLYVTVTDAGLLARFARLRRWMVAALLFTIVGAFAVLVLYKCSETGPSYQLLNRGVAQYYYLRIVPRLRNFSI